MANPKTYHLPLYPSREDITRVYRRMLRDRGHEAYSNLSDVDVLFDLDEQLAVEEQQQRRYEIKQAIKFIVIEAIFVWFFFAGMTGTFVFGDTPQRLLEVLFGLGVMLPAFLAVIAYPVILWAKN